VALGCPKCGGRFSEARPSAPSVGGRARGRAHARAAAQRELRLTLFFLSPVLLIRVGTTFFRSAAACLHTAEAERRAGCRD
jgi:hypothetical protein